MHRISLTTEKTEKEEKKKRKKGKKRKKKKPFIVDRALLILH